MAKTAKNAPQYRLSSIDLDEVSLVTSGDDGLAKIVLSKADPGSRNTKDGEETTTLPHKRHGGNTMAKSSKTATITKQDREGLSKSVREYLESLEDVVLDGDIEKDDDDDETETNTETDSGDDVDDDETDDDDTDDDESSDDEDEDDEDDSEDDDPPPTKNKGKDKKVTKSAPVRRRNGSVSKSALEKASPELREYIEKIEQDRQDDRKQLAEVEKIAKAERGRRERQEWIAKAEKLPTINTNANELAGLMQSLSEKAPDEAAVVEKLFGAAHAQLSKSALFQEFGRGGFATAGAGRVEGAVTELRKADPKLTREQAYAKALEADPTLYDEEMEGK